MIPENADALHFLGVLEAQRGRYESAADLIGRAALIAWLWLLEVDCSIKRNRSNEAQTRGVSPDRILFARFIRLKDHLARGRLADLPLPVNAHTTASDALWMGVPVLTCLGTTFAGRVAPAC